MRKNNRSIRATESKNGNDNSDFWKYYARFGEPHSLRLDGMKGGGRTALISGHVL